MTDGLRIARAVRSGGSSAEAEIRAALDRAAAAEPLNAFTRLDPDGALRRAIEIDERVASGGDPGPLAGVPIVLKDIIDQAGIPTTAGSSFLRDPASHDAPVVERLEAAGAVIIGRTGLHEFAYGFSSENDWWGPVRNPWDPAMSPGGSSGGTASAVAAGVAPIGIGTDTGGSVRVPAALCGLVGLKVTHGRIPLTGVFPLAASLDTVGPIATTVADAATTYAVIAGHHPHDPWSHDRPVHPPAADPLGSLTIGIPHPWVDRAIAPEQASGFDIARSALAEAGYSVVDLDLPAIDHRDIERVPGLYHEVADVHRAWHGEDPTRYGAGIRDRLAATIRVSAAEIEEGRAWRAGLVSVFDDAFRSCDVILTPATAARFKPIGVDFIDVGAGPEPYRPVLAWFTPLVNQAGVPALVLPVEDPGVGGLPPAIQLIGPGWSESRLLGLGLTLDRIGLIAHRESPFATPESRVAYNDRRPTNTG